GGRISLQHLLGSRGEDRYLAAVEGRTGAILIPSTGGTTNASTRAAVAQERQGPAGVPGPPGNADVAGPDRGPRKPETAKQQEGLDAFLRERLADSIGENDIGHPRQIPFTTRAGRGRSGLAAGRHRRTERPRTVTTGWSGRSTPTASPRSPWRRQC